MKKTEIYFCIINQVIVVIVFLSSALIIEGKPTLSQHSVSDIDKEKIKNRDEAYRNYHFKMCSSSWQLKLLFDWYKFYYIDEMVDSLLGDVYGEGYHYHSEFLILGLQNFLYYI